MMSGDQAPGGDRWVPSPATNAADGHAGSKPPDRIDLGNASTSGRINPALSEPRGASGPSKRRLESAVGDTTAKRCRPHPSVADLRKERAEVTARPANEHSNISAGSRMLDLDHKIIEASTRCPICLGIIKQCRTVKVCLHRFCGECIEQALRFNNNECPACRSHLPSRRALHRDTRFDALVTAIYGNIHGFEEKESKQLDEDTKVYASQFQQQNRALLSKLNCRDKFLPKAPGAGKWGATDKDYEYPGYY